MGSRLLGVRGRIQCEGLVIHLVAEQLWDWSPSLIPSPTSTNSTCPRPR